MPISIGGNRLGPSTAPRQGAYARRSPPNHAGAFPWRDRKSTRLNSSHLVISYAVFCLKKKNIQQVGCCMSPSYLSRSQATDSQGSLPVMSTPSPTLEEAPPTRPLVSKWDANAFPATPS